MGKRDEFNNLRREMEQVQRAREKKHRNGRDEAIEGTDPLIERVKLEVEGIARAFVASDNLLEIQSNFPNGLSIVYANVKLFAIWISVPNEDDVRIHTMVNSSLTEDIYSGKFDKKAIQTALKGSLLNWYRDI